MFVFAFMVGVLFLPCFINACTLSEMTNYNCDIYCDTRNSLEDILLWLKVEPILILMNSFCGTERCLQTSDTMLTQTFKIQVVSSKNWTILHLNNIDKKIGYC